MSIATTVTPSTLGGTREYDETYFSATFNSPATFTAEKAGKTTISYTVDGETISREITILAAKDANGTTSPKTGDGQAALWYGVALAAVVLAVVYTLRTRRRTMR